MAHIVCRIGYVAYSFKEHLLDYHNDDKNENDYSNANENCKYN